MAEFSNRLDVICLESKAFYRLVEDVVERLGGSQTRPPEQWINDEQAMKLLHITSRTTLQKYRDEGSIRYSQPSRKLILYDRDSILTFIEKHAKDTF